MVRNTAKTGKSQCLDIFFRKRSVFEWIAIFSFSYGDSFNWLPEFEKEGFD